MKDIQEAGSTNTFDEGVNQLRRVSSGLLTIFAGVAAVMLTGLSISGFGRLSGPFNILAGLSICICLFCVGVIIYLNTRVLTTGLVNRVSLGTFKSTQSSREINLDDSDLLGGFASVTDFLNAYSSSVDKPGQEQSAERQRLEKTLASLKPIARYAFVLRAFNESVRWSFVSAAIAAIAIIIFAWISAQEPIYPTVYVTPPSTGKLILSSEAKAQDGLLARVLGADCVALQSIDVIVLGVEETKQEIVTMPSAECKVAKFMVDKDIGQVDAVLP